MTTIRRFLFPLIQRGLPCLLAWLLAHDVAKGDEEPTRWASPPLQQSISIRDGRTDEILTWGEFVESLAEADVVFLGESHLDETTHRTQLAIYEELLDRREQRVVLALEMFERDVQPKLNAYLKGEIEESEFLEAARPWGNYRTAYRPLVERARRHSLPVVASNFPRPLLRRMALEGTEILESLPENEQGWVPCELLPNSDAYWRRAENATRSHRGMVRESDRLYSTQSLWDNTMGESCADALKEWPGNLVLHINGDFHSTYWDGTVHQLQKRNSEARVRTVSMVPVMNPASAQLTGSPIADYVVFVEALAEERSDDTWAVWTSKKHDFRFHLPREASEESPAPLLMVLPEEGLTAEETMDLWRERLGDACAIAVLDPLYLEQQSDQGVGGRWYWNDSFTTDIGGTVAAVERMWAFLARHYPIDPERIVLLGEGTAGTVATAAVLLTQRMDVRGMVIQPRRFAQLKDLPLPLPEEWGNERPPQRHVTLIPNSRDVSWWEGEVAEFRDVGIEATLQPSESDPWQRESTLDNLLRSQLGLPTITGPTSESRYYFLLDSDAPRALHWARLQSLWTERALGQAVAIFRAVPEDPDAHPLSLEIQPENLAEPGMLPLCPGPFGGTTVVVLPPAVSDERRETWLALQAEDPLAKSSRFHRLRVATTDGEFGLTEVLETLQSENRRNVLIVPATFHAESTWLNELRRKTRQLEDQMTLNWLPGLGGIRGLVGSEPVVQAENWPGWRGPRGDGTSREKGVPREWDAGSGKNIAWKTAIPGDGHGSPIVWDDSIFLLSCLTESEQRILLRLDRRTGAIVWQRTVVASPLETVHARNSHASSTPATDGQSVYVTFLEVDGSTVPATNVSAVRPVTPGQIVVAAYDFDGNRQWKVRLGDFVSVHGFCSNPVIYGDLLIINGDHDGESYIAALHKQTGEVAWKVPRAHRTRSYVTPLIRVINGRVQMVLSGSHHIASLDPRDGTEHWKIDGPTEQFVASMVYDGKQFYAAAGYPTYHVMAIRPDGEGNVTDTHVAWHSTSARCYVPSPIVVDNYLLVADDRGTANLFDTATGERLWQARVGHHFSTSPVTAGGLIYLVADDGITKVIAPGEQLQIVSQNPLGEFTYSSPAISRGQVFIRGEKHLFCIGKPQ